MFIIWDHFGSFLPKLEPKWIFLEKELCQFLNIPIIYRRAKSQKQLMSHSWEKMLNWQIDKQTGRRMDKQTMMIL